MKLIFRNFISYLLTFSLTRESMMQKIIWSVPVFFYIGYNMLEIKDITRLIFTLTFIATFIVVYYMQEKYLPLWLCFFLVSLALMYFKHCVIVDSLCISLLYIYICFVFPPENLIIKVILFFCMLVTIFYSFVALYETFIVGIDFEPEYSKFSPIASAIEIYSEAMSIFGIECDSSSGSTTTFEKTGGTIKFTTQTCMLSSVHSLSTFSSITGGAIIGLKLVSKGTIKHAALGVGCFGLGSVTGMGLQVIDFFRPK